MNKKNIFESKGVWDQGMQAGQRNLIVAIRDHWPQGVKTALDIGCGDGKLTHALSEQLTTLFYGFDNSVEALSRLNIPAFRGDIGSLPFDQDAFDLLLTTDVFEHLPDSVEQKAWLELFRVARNWVIFAVPFRENLLDGAIKCTGCGLIYHINWHLRQYDFDDLLNRIPRGWELDRIILSGERWSSYLPPEIEFRRNQMGEYATWDEAICPKCGKSCDTNTSFEALQNDDIIQLGDKIYQDIKHHKYMRNYTELVGIYRRSGLNIKDDKRTTESPQSITLGSSTWITRLGFDVNLDPFPQIAKAVVNPNEIVVQFPVYPDNEGKLKIRCIYSGRIDIVVEDGIGFLFSGAIELKNGECSLVFGRKAVSGYYGLLVRLPKSLEIQAIEFCGGGGDVVYLFNEMGKTFYHYLPEEKLYLQVKNSTDWFDYGSLFCTDRKFTLSINQDS